MFDRFIPSMFKRRLLLLAVAAALVLCVLLIQLVRLTVVQGAQWRDKAEQALTSHRLIPTARGAILDRHGRILAVDKPSYDVAVMYEVINGDWAYRQARSQAWRKHRHQWQELGEEEREKLVTGFLPQWNAQVDRLWTTLCKLGRIDRDALEQRKAEIIRRVEQIANDVWARQQARRAAQMEEEGEAPPLIKRPISEHRSPHAILENVTEDTLLQIRHLIALAESNDEAPPTAGQTDDSLKAWEEVSIQASRQRVYPLETLTVNIDLSTFPGALRQQKRVDVTVEGVAWSMIGDMRTIWREDVERRPYSTTLADGTKHIDLGGYLPGDRTGRWGIEQAFEDVLRGHRGRILEYVDKSHEDVRVDPVAGRNVTMTLDIRLQARIQALMDPRLGLTRVQPWHAKEYSTIADVQPGEESTVDPLRPKLGEALNAAAVIIDIGSGEILAAVSMPTVGKRQLNDDPDSVWGDTVNRPFTNRAIAVPYQPGSTMKPVTLLACVAEGLLAADGAISGTGHLYPNLPNQYRCWIYKHYNGLTHDQVVGHPLNGAEAIARSCNIFFYTMGMRLGTAKLVIWFRKFGLGSTFDCGLPEESRGRIPSIIDAREPHRGGPSEAIMMGIGQGRVEWTVLQAANVYATVARGGYMLAPTFIRDVQGEAPRTRRREDLHLDPRAIDIVMQGLFESVNKPYGTAHHLALLEGKPLIFDFPVDLGQEPDTYQAEGRRSRVVRRLRAEARVGSPGLRDRRRRRIRRQRWGGRRSDCQPDSLRDAGGGLPALKRESLWHRALLIHPAWYGLAAAVGLAMMGIAAIGTTHADYASAQTKWLVISLMAMIACLAPSAKHIGIVAFPLMFAIIGLLILMMLPGVPSWLVPVRNGTRAWINLRFMMLQPSELAKIVFVLALARYLRYRENYRTMRGLLVPFGIMFIPVLLILKQPDLGTAILFPVALFAVLVAAGAKLKHLGSLAALAILAVALNIAAIYLLPESMQLLRPHQRARIVSMISQARGDDRYNDGDGYQQHKAMTLIGSGQTTGFGKDRAAVIIKHNKLPEDHNDMIFAVIVNRWGLKGAVGLLGLFGVLIGSMMLTAARTKDPFARLSVVGFAGLLFTQMAINIGMNIGLLPIIGITLPFVSYGGSSLVATFLMVGLVLNFAMQRQSILARPSFEFHRAEERDMPRGLRRA